MKPIVCAHCGSGIEGKPVTFHGQLFCSDECCEAFDEDLALRGGPGDDELDDDLDGDFDDDFDEDDFDEDDFDEDDDDDLFDDDDEI